MIDSSDATRALALATRHINASRRDTVDEAQLLAALLSGDPSEGMQEHLRAFFDEIEPETLSDLVRSGVIGYADLARGAARTVPPTHPTRRWLDERA